jgi:predicted Rossmann fold nucleotide-binding protein DprA/Smf involved in DNA uptake
MVNEDYTPSKKEERILDLLQQGRVTPKLVKDETGLNDQQVNYALNQLMAAGWVQRVTTGLYELVEDPREDV